jgi:hypothetical protein
MSIKIEAAKRLLESTEYVDASGKWITQNKVTLEGAEAFVQWFIKHSGQPAAFIKAAKQIKHVKVGMPSGAPSGAALLMNVGTNTLYFGVATQWGPQTLDDVVSKFELRHELGHIIWHKLQTKPFASAFVEAVKAESSAGKFISTYQETWYKRYRANPKLFGTFIHETFAEWCRFGTSESRGCPKELASFKDVFAHY